LGFDQVRVETYTVAAINSMRTSVFWRAPWILTP